MTLHIAIDRVCRPLPEEMKAMRFTLRALSPDGIELIKAVEEAAPTLALGEREVDVYVADGGELAHVLAKFSPRWQDLVEVRRDDSLPRREGTI